MADLDRTTAVLSIRPVYVDRILDGSKTIEFRRRPLPETVETILIWCTGKGGGFAGLAEVEGSTTIPASSWDTARGKGIETADLCAYAGGDDCPVTGIYLGGVVRFPEIMPGWVLGTDRAPQSWRYASESWRFMLTEMEVIR